MCFAQISQVAPGELSVLSTWLGAIAYSLQIYFDFSGYSDMAIGLGKMLGFDFLENFNYPYIAKSITDFWRRWHISLSTWFRDYVYIPLGGNRKGLKKAVPQYFYCVDANWYLARGQLELYHLGVCITRFLLMLEKAFSG